MKLFLAVLALVGLVSCSSGNSLGKSIAAICSTPLGTVESSAYKIVSREGYALVKLYLPNGSVAGYIPINHCIFSAMGPAEEAKPEGLETRR